jgi:pimeloyl-ACP methyl ester carboxylesterase
VLVGHSWGGNVVVEFAATRPERALGLVLVDGGFGQLSGRPGMTRERALEMLRPPDIDGMPVADMVAWGQANIPGWNDEVREILSASFYVSDDGKVSRRFPVPQHMQVVEALWDQKLSDLYPKLRCPVILVPAYMEGGDGAAERMAMKREGVAQALALLADGRLEEMNDTIHDVPLQRPEELGAIIGRFAASVTVAPLEG